MSEPATPQVTYAATSIFTSKTFWFNAASGLVAILSASDVLTIIPPRFLPTVTAIVAAINIMLRFASVRPVALIAPGTMAPVLVEKLTLPQATPTPAPEKLP